MALFPASRPWARRSREAVQSPTWWLAAPTAPAPVLAAAMRRAKKDPIARMLAKASALGVRFRIAGATLQIGGAGALHPDDQATLRRYLVDIRARLEPPAPEVDLLEELDVGVEYVADIDRALEVLAALGPGALGFDIETAGDGSAARPWITITKAGLRSKRQPDGEDDGAGLDPIRARVRLAQIYDPAAATVYVLDLFAVPIAVLAALEDRPLLIHNSGFELAMLGASGIHLRRAWCTLQMARLALGAERGGLRLADVAAEFLDGLELPKDEQVSDWWRCKVIRASDSLCRDRRRGRAPGRGAALERPGRRRAPGVQARQRDGAGGGRHAPGRDPVRAGRCTRRRSPPGSGITSRRATRSWRSPGRRSRPPARGAAPGSRRACRRTCWPGGRALRPGCSGRAPPTSSAWRRCRRSGRCSTWCTGTSACARSAHVLLERVGADGRLRMDLKPAWTKTGRCSCSDPNLQQLPQDCRRAVVAPPGRTLVIADYGQIELRTAAELSGDEAMRQVFRDGQDMHTLNAEAFTGVSMADLPEAERSTARSKAKRIGFGTLYGSGPGGLVASAWSMYRVEMTEEEAAAYKAAFYARYPMLRRWQNETANIARATGVAALGRRPAAQGRAGRAASCAGRSAATSRSRARPPT